MESGLCLVLIKVNIIACCLALDRLPTKANLVNYGMYIPSLLFLVSPMTNLFSFRLLGGRA